MSRTLARSEHAGTIPAGRVKETVFRSWIKQAFGRALVVHD